MATERQDQFPAHELPSERILPRPPAPRTKDADFLARLNEVYGHEPDHDDERLIAGTRSAFRRLLKNER
jgi:hypothetical protein